SFYFDVSGELAVNNPSEEITWPSYEPAFGTKNLWINGAASVASPKLQVLKLGSKSQQVLTKKCDDIRIDWGSLYLAAPADELSGASCTTEMLAREGFVGLGRA